MRAVPLPSWLRREGGDNLVTRVFVPAAAAYWRGATAREAWSLTVGLGLAVLLGIGCGIAFSMWNRWFFDSLEQRDAVALGHSILAVLLLVVCATGCDVTVVLVRATIQVRWRTWFSRGLIDRWLGRQRFYHLNGSGDDNATVPEYRIADDVRWATEPVMDFYVGILGATTSIIGFVGILWVVGGSITLGTGPVAITVPGYIALAGVLHAGLVVTLMLTFGHTLPGRIAARNEAEARFRAALMRVRENAETVALTSGHAGEGAILRRVLDALARQWMTVVRQEGRLTWIQRGNTALLPVVPLLLTAPKYLSGELSLGAMMQIASAYAPFQLAVAWAVENFRPLSIWHASARRVGALIQSMRDLDDDLDRSARASLRIEHHDEPTIRIEELTVADRDGRTIVEDVDLVVAPGERLLIVGPSGSGKSALVRAIAGLWPWASGAVRLPGDARMMFLPPHVYLPLGSLRDALAYPLERLEVDDGRIVAVMVACGVGHLAPRIDAVERWDQSLSNGERQRLAFARLLLHRPTVVILDDGLAALDSEAQAVLLVRLREELPESTLITVTRQHADLARHHDRVVMLRRADGPARLLTSSTPRLVLADVAG